MDNENLIQKWLSDELTVEETKVFDALEDAPFYEGILRDAKHFKALNFSKMEDFDHFKEKVLLKETKVRKLQWMQPMLRIASVLLVFLGLYYFFIFDTSTEVRTLVAEKTTMELPDNTQVVLNALSEVRYDEKGWATKREIELKGEAFFDVAKGAKFDVITSIGVISVLGTEFNVKQRGDFFEVACFEGMVRVVVSGHTKILKAGDKFGVYEGKVLAGQNSYETPQWTKNMSHFQRIPVSEVLAELERQYGITIIQENVNTTQLFTGGFGHGNLENALIAISEPLGLDYQILKSGEVRLTMSEK